MNISDVTKYFSEVNARLDSTLAIARTVAGLQNYFEEMRVRIGVVRTVKKEIDRLVAPDFSLFNVLWADEVRLSNMIATLLDPTAQHGQGSKFLVAFLLGEFNFKVQHLKKKKRHRKNLINLNHHNLKSGAYDALHSFNLTRTI